MSCSDLPYLLHLGASLYVTQSRRHRNPSASLTSRNSCLGSHRSHMLPSPLLHPLGSTDDHSQKDRCGHPHGPRRSVSPSLSSHALRFDHLTILSSAFVFAILRAASLSLRTSDTTYDYTLTGTWMTLETNIGLIASNIGPMYALFRMRHGKKSPSYYNTSQTFAGLIRAAKPAMWMWTMIRTGVFACIQRVAQSETRTTTS